MAAFLPTFHPVPVREANLGASFIPRRVPGTQIDHRHQPGELFLMMMEESFEMVVQATNWKGVRIYAMEGKIWEPLVMDEFLDFVGVCCMIGVFGKIDDEISTFWAPQNSAFSLPMFNKIMKYERFAEIMGCLHFGKPDPGIFTADTRFFTAGFTKLLAAYAPQREIKINEVFLPMEESGDCSFTVFRADLFPYTAMKVVELVEARFGYKLACVVHGEPLPGLAGKPLAYRTIWNLLQRADLLGQGFHLFTERSYSVRAAFEDLVRERVYCCGSVVPRYSSGIPQSLLTGDAANHQVVGDYYFVHTMSSSFVTWRDAGGSSTGNTRRILYTLPEVTDQTSPATREYVEQDTEDPAAKLTFQITIPRPKIVEIFDNFVTKKKMERSAATANLFNLNLHTKMGMKDWHRALWFYLVTVAAYNTYVIKSKSCSIHGILEAEGCYKFERCVREIVEYLLEKGRGKHQNY